VGVFTPITTRAHVPQVGQGFESPVLDLKEHPEAYKRHVNGERQWDYFELAKDVAAFANNLGGTILVGAKQNAATGTCSAHTPFATVLATEFENRVRDALKRCRPVPMVSLDPIPFDGNVMIAVNVWAFPGQVVAVEVTGDKERGGYGGAAYVFPRRVLSHTDYLPADQTPMLMSPDARRTAILLSRLKMAETIVVHPKIVVPEERGVKAFKVQFVAVDEMKNSLTLQIGPPGPQVGVPIDDVLAWFEMDGCHIRCDRHLIIMR
jgi:hypothetical protein